MKTEKQKSLEELNKIYQYFAKKNKEQKQQ